MKVDRVYFFFYYLDIDRLIYDGNNKSEIEVLFL